MNIQARCLLATLVPVLLSPGCAGIPRESREHRRQHLERQDGMVDRRLENSKVRSEATDLRYDHWWRNAVGKPSDPQAWQQTY